MMLAPFYFQPTLNRFFIYCIKLYCWNRKRGVKLTNPPRPKKKLLSKSPALSGLKTPLDHCLGVYSCDKSKDSLVTIFLYHLVTFYNISIWSRYNIITCNHWLLENEVTFFVILSTSSAIIITVNTDILESENLTRNTYLCVIGRKLLNQIRFMNFSFG